MGKKLNLLESLIIRPCQQSLASDFGILYVFMVFFLR
jgi:hypothetical protein